MKRPLYFFVAFLVVLIPFSKAQRSISDGKYLYSIEGVNNYTLTKTQIGLTQALYRVDLKIPNEKQNETTDLYWNKLCLQKIDDQLILIYDVWQESSNTKDCWLKTFNPESGAQLSNKLIFSTKLNQKKIDSFEHLGEVMYKAHYSPDKSKLLIVKCNILNNLLFDTEACIFDAKTLVLISQRKMSQDYLNQKRTFDENRFSISNNGDIALAFFLMNDKTKIVTKAFTSELKFNAREINNIQTAEGLYISDTITDLRSYGRLYYWPQDFPLANFIPNIRVGKLRITLGTLTWECINDEGEIEKKGFKELPSTLLTSKSSYRPHFEITLIEDHDFKKVEVGGKYFLFISEPKQSSSTLLERHYSEGWLGKRKYFDEDALEKLLKKEGLFEVYENEKPERQRKEKYNDYFNRMWEYDNNWLRRLNEHSGISYF